MTEERLRASYPSDEQIAAYAARMAAERPTKTCPTCGQPIHALAP